MRRRVLRVCLVVAALGLTAPGAGAGGWATVRLDEPPGEVLAGVPWSFGFMVKQHDVTPNGDVTPRVAGQHRATGETVSATGRQEGAVGHFVAEITFPTAGEWKWSITPEPFAGTAFETLIVRDAAGGATASSARPVRQARIAAGSCREPASTPAFELVDLGLSEADAAGR